MLLSGGSAFGLDAAGGVMKYLEEKKIGFPVGMTVVPIVCTSCLFDLELVNYKVRPDAGMAYEACLDAEKKRADSGNIGAGTGATVGKFKGGIYDEVRNRMLCGTGWKSESRCGCGGECAWRCL